MVLGMRPRISVVITNYNYRRYLRGAVESVRSQEYGEKEVVVVDDGSTDGSVEILGELERWGVKVIAKRNGGVASAINAGFRASTGEVVLFLDADDGLRPGALEKIAGVWGEGVAKVHYWLEAVDGEGRCLGWRVPNQRLSRGDVLGQLRKNGEYFWPPMSGNAFARWALERVLPLDEEQWRKHADTALGLGVVALGRVAAVDEALGEFRLHGGNLTSFRVPTVEALRAHIAADRRAEELMVRVGAGVPARTYSKGYLHLKMCMTCAVLDKDPRAGLWVRALGSLARSSEMTVRKRAVLSLWFSGMAVLPRGWARQLIPAAYDPGRRPGVLARSAG